MSAIRRLTIKQQYDKNRYLKLKQDEKKYTTMQKRQEKYRSTKKYKIYMRLYMQQKRGEQNG